MIQNPPLSSSTLFPSSSRLGGGLGLGFPPPPPLDSATAMNGSTPESLLKNKWRVREAMEKDPKGLATPSSEMQLEPMAPAHSRNEGTLQTGETTAFGHSEKLIQGSVGLNTSSHIPKNIGQLHGHVASPVGESEAMRRWKEMKQNGFLSHPNGGVPIPPQPPTKKSRRKEKGTDAKKKIEATTGEQVIRFKTAPCSGLLSTVSTGIIRRVKNDKEVHATLEAMVRLYKKPEGHMQNEDIRDNRDSSGDVENILILRKLFLSNDSCQAS